MHARIIDVLNRDFACFGVRGGVTAADHVVIVPQHAAQALLQSLGQVDGASAVSRIRSLLDTRSRGDIALSVPDAEQLSRLLGDAERTKRRNDQIDRGQIPGPMSSREVMRFARKHPGMFGR
jgi:hypothetical protein